MSKGLPRLVFLTMMVVALAFGAANVLAQQEKAVPERHHTGTRIITIASGAVNPVDLEINRGETVIWFPVDQPATIYFPEGNEVRLACVAPTRFYLNEEGAYTSGIIPPGATASLCFVEPGTYKYVAFLRGGMGGFVAPRGTVPTGTITVR